MLTARFRLRHYDVMVESNFRTVCVAKRVDWSLLRRSCSIPKRERERERAVSHGKIQHGGQLFPYLVHHPEPLLRGELLAFIFVARPTITCIPCTRPLVHRDQIEYTAPCVLLCPRVVCDGWMPFD